MTVNDPNPTPPSLPKLDRRATDREPPRELAQARPQVVRTGTYWLRATVGLLAASALIGIVAVTALSQNSAAASRTTIESLEQQLDDLRIQLDAQDAQLAENDDAALCRSAVAAYVNDADAETDIAKATQGAAFDALAAAILAGSPPDQLAIARDALNAAATALDLAASNYRTKVDEQQAVIKAQRAGTFTSCPV